MASMNAACAGIGSGMLRFYTSRTTALFAAGVLLLSSAAGAQTAPAARSPLGSVITIGPLAMLPSTEDLIELAGAEIPEIIADRVDTGGLSTGDPARIGARGSSWTQSTIRVGDADLTDPLRGGTPLLLPRPDTWDRAEVVTGIMPIELNAPGLAIGLTPRRPGDAWHGSIAVAASSPSVYAGASTDHPPSIARLDSWGDLSGVAGGPVSPTSGLFVAASGTRSVRFERADPLELHAISASTFAHVRVTPSAGNSLGFVGWFQRAEFPFPNRIAFGQPSAAQRTAGLHAQGSWDHAREGSTWTSTTFAGVTVGDRRDDLAPSAEMVIERLTDGPVPELLDRGSATMRNWSAGFRAHRSSGRHQAVIGVEGAGSGADVRSAFSGRIAELLNGEPARIWDYTASTTPSAWTEASLSLYAADRIALGSRTTVDGGVRFETLHAGNGTESVSFNDVYPRGGVRIALTDTYSTAAFVSAGRYGHRLPLADLAWGDPSAPHGTVSLWNAPAGLEPAFSLTPGTLIARVGPGSAGNPSFSAIDPSLRRPYMDEFIAGAEGRPNSVSTVRLSAFARRERHLIGAVNVGVPESTYSVMYIPDHGADEISSSDDQLLPVYNRNPATFGADRYLLTNPPDDESTFVGGELTYELHGEHLYLLMGATAGRSEIIAANRGFNAIENDNGVVGDAYIDPNSRTFAQGRPFTERGYTLKWSGAYHWNTGASFGLVARYQDGQHFARIVIVPGLNQGVEQVRAFRNGKTRFTFINTLDARYLQPFRIGRLHLQASVDAYNLLATALEIEEYPVTGPLSRTTTAVQPPFAVHFGIRVAF
jgi:hypothetical protein